MKNKKYAVDFNEYRFTNEEKENIQDAMIAKLDDCVSIFDGMTEILFNSLQDACSFVQNDLSTMKKRDKKATIIYDIWDGYIDEDGEFYCDALMYRGAAQL